MIFVGKCVVVVFYGRLGVMLFVIFVIFVFCRWVMKVFMNCCIMVGVLCWCSRVIFEWKLVFLSVGKLMFVESEILVMFCGMIVMLKFVLIRFSKEFLCEVVCVMCG